MALNKAVETFLSSDLGTQIQPPDSKDGGCALVVMTTTLARLQIRIPVHDGKQFSVELLPSIFKSLTPSRLIQTLIDLP